jgi:bla regulator protein blaR1
MSPMDVLHGIPHLLWTTSWQAGAMAAAIWLACRQWPRMPANLRIVLWWLVSLKFVIGLVWTQPIALPVLPASFAPPTAIVDLARPSDRLSDRLSDGLSADALASQERSTAIGSSAIARSVPTIATIAVSCWLIGILLQGGLLLRQLARTRRLVARSQPVEGDAEELFDDLLARLEIRTSRPRLHVSTEIATPQVTGLTHPVILLPVGALESFTTRELSLTLCHELIHVQRFDLWHGWIPSIAARLFFFHPLARLAAREYAIAREAACDARVLAFMQAPAHDYGRLLMRLGVTARDGSPAAASASPTFRTLKRRLLMLHDASPNPRRLSRRWWVLAAIAGLLVIPMRPTAQQQKPQPAPPKQQQPPSADAATTAPKDDRDDAWVFLQPGDNASMHGSSMDLIEAKRLRANSGEPLIWFKHDGRAYVIRDRQMVDQAHALFIPQHELSKAQQSLDARQTDFGDRQKAFDKTQEALREQMRTFDEKVKAAADALQKGVDRQTVHSEVEKQIVQMEVSLHQAEATRRAVQQQQEALGAQQRVLGELQAQLGAEQEALGRQQEELARAITWEMRTLLNNAITAGRATPVK